MTGMSVDTFESMASVMPAINLDFKSVKIDAKGIVDSAKKGGKDAGLKTLIESLPLPADQKILLSWFASSQYDYVTWCGTEGKTLYTKQSVIAYVLKKGPKFLAESSKAFGKYSHEQNVVCVSTIAAVLLELRSRVGLLKGGLIGGTAGIGLLMLDILEVGNSCEFIQEGYYDLFLKSSDVNVKLSKRRSNVPPKDIFQILSPTIGTAHRQMMCSK
jgi:hypothetical protein